MHELSLCLSILNIIEKQIDLIGTRRIKIIYLEIGELAGVDQEALLFAFPLAAKGTLAEHAKLKFISISSKAQCQICKKIIDHYQFGDGCCDLFDLKIIEGTDFKIRELEVI